MNTIKLTKLFLLVGIGLSLMTSCAKEDEIVDSRLKSIDSDKGVKTELDFWAEKNFTMPYNTRLIYKYDDTKFDANRYVTPVSYEKAVQMANILKYLYFEPFRENTSEEFMKRFAPREIVLYGSAAYNPNGTRVLGQAESGVKFSLLEINELDVSNSKKLFKNYFRTIYHEFGHILHQTEMFTNEYGKITSTDYVGDSWSVDSTWENKNNYELGFITRYSANTKEDDFVEIFAHYITMSPSDFQALIDKGMGADANNPKEGKVKLEKKVKIVKEYMKKTWNIDMDALRDDILERASKLQKLDVNNLK